jgi:16S rRNA (uracil1498-N3)-methyltransferase
MPKFFVEKSQISGGAITITGEDAAHIARVLRTREGDALTVCDGLGNDYDVRVTRVSPTEVSTAIERCYRCGAEPAVEVILFQALPKQGKMEVIIQKTTELGVAKIIPVSSARCVAKPTDKLTRWRRVAREAAKQCGRGCIPEVCETVSFDEAAARLSLMEHRVMLYECEQTVRLRQILSGAAIAQIGMLVGPEGGFDGAEAALARARGIPTVTLGKRVLRTETAAAATLPVIMYSQNDL